MNKKIVWIKLIFNQEEEGFQQEIKLGISNCNGVHISKQETSILFINPGSFDERKSPITRYSLLRVEINFHLKINRHARKLIKKKVLQPIFPPIRALDSSNLGKTLSNKERFSQFLY